MASTFKLYKLIILYMLNKVDFPLTNSQISEFILDEGYTTYFKLQQALAELAESGFIREESTHSRTFYHLTEEGRETLHFFKNDISTAIQEDIDSFLKEKNYELKNGVLHSLPGGRAGRSPDRSYRHRAYRKGSRDDRQQLAAEK